MKVGKFLVAFMFSLIFMAQSCFAMKFSKPVEIGQIGFPIQAQIHGLIVTGTSSNDGKARSEHYSSRFIVGEVDKTYTKGTARWGDGEDALYCKYNHDERYIKFGGKNNYVIETVTTYQHIFKINTDSGITLYNIWLFSGYKNFNIIGRQKDGKWVSYIDCEKIAQTYFGGHIAYKQRGGVDYDEPKFQNDTIIVTYKNYSDMGQIINQGEFRFKWNDAAQWFGVEQVIY